ncbi:MAG: MFS transporter, partial [Alphaproteobacteria bacterium]|nr:MFS transporter [Alphaproteobacteria bacterium]
MSDFSKLLAAYAATQLGDQITLLALPLIAALVLGSGPVEMGWLAAAAALPYFLFGLPAGVWVDRLPRRSVIIAGDLLR